MQNRSADLEIPAYGAQCLDCETIFNYPSFGQHSYGRFIFNSACGQHYQYFSISNPVTKLVEVLLPENCHPVGFQSTLAAVADLVHGEALQITTKCPKCRSEKLASCGEASTGILMVKAAQYEGLLNLSRNELIRKVQAVYRELS